MIRILVQGIGLALLAFAYGFFRTKTYKKEFTLFGLSGLTLIMVGSCAPS
ncbi:hypothetical protein [Lysinibacillus xylanilyticus]